MRLKLFAILACAGACFAQNKWEFGGVIGYGAYHNGSVITTAGTADAGIRNRFAASAIIGEDMYSHIGGEVRYLYHDGDPFAESGGTKANIQGQSHAFHYNLLLYAFDREARIRPYAAAGAGAKYYETTGPAPNPQPLRTIVSLAPANEWKALGTFGGGVKLRVTDHVLVRGEFLDYITPFPKKLFIPAPNGTDRGILHTFTPMFGLSYSF
ncbi:MAG TPA: outer membrane beta-barrel protein [Bryobacteraceae bacterium]